MGAAIVAHFGPPWGAGVKTVKWARPSLRMLFPQVVLEWMSQLACTWACACARVCVCVDRWALTFRGVARGVPGCLWSSKLVRLYVCVRPCVRLCVCVFCSLRMVCPQEVHARGGSLPQEALLPEMQST